MTGRPSFLERLRNVRTRLRPPEPAANAVIVVLALGLLGVSVWAIADDGAPAWVDALSGWLGWGALAAVVIMLVTGRRAR